MTVDYNTRLLHTEIEVLKEMLADTLIRVSQLERHVRETTDYTIRTGGPVPPVRPQIGTPITKIPKVT